MSSLIESYEHQYSSITAEITSHIGRVPNLASGNDGQTTIHSIIFLYFISIQIQIYSTQAVIFLFMA